MSEVTDKAKRNTSVIGPYSKGMRRGLCRPDMRTREGRYLKEVEAGLLSHVGGWDKASVPQRLLIKRISTDMLRLELLDQRMSTGNMTDYDMKIGHALRAAIRLALRDLGLQPAAARPLSLDEDMARRMALKKAQESLHG